MVVVKSSNNKLEWLQRLWLEEVEKLEPGLSLNKVLEMDKDHHSNDKNKCFSLV